MNPTSSNAPVFRQVVIFDMSTTFLPWFGVLLISAQLSGDANWPVWVPLVPFLPMLTMILWVGFQVLAKGYDLRFSTRFHTLQVFSTGAAMLPVWYRLTGVIDWPWVWVTIPIWPAAGLAALGLMSVIMLWSIKSIRWILNFIKRTQL